MRPGTDAVGQALGGIAEAYAAPGEPMRTGVVSVADESCAILAFGGLMAALYCAKTTGVGQKVETSLVGATVRLMGWTLTTTMWRDAPPITGARINGTRTNPGIAATFNDHHGKPLVIQLESRHWQPAMEALGFWETLVAHGAQDLGLAVESEQVRNRILTALAHLFAADSRERWLETLRAADIVCAPVNSLLEASSDDNVLANGYIQEMDYGENGRLKIHGTPWRFSETPVVIGKAPKLGEHNKEVLAGLGYSDADIDALAERGVT
jgi:crotonobetainyl-CoA:carnitine CoA-transferase CaiB-like acyl-CoA transferase